MNRTESIFIEIERNNDLYFDSVNLFQSWEEVEARIREQYPTQLEWGKTVMIQVDLRGQSGHFTTFFDLQHFERAIREHKSETSPPSATDQQVRGMMMTLLREDKEVMGVIGQVVDEYLAEHDPDIALEARIKRWVPKIIIDRLTQEREES